MTQIIFQFRTHKSVEKIYLADRYIRVSALCFHEKNSFFRDADQFVFLCVYHVRAYVRFFRARNLFISLTKKYIHTV